MADTSPPSGPSSPTQATSAQRKRSLTDEDESVMIAVRALDDMRSRAIPPSARYAPYQITTSPHPTPALSPASTSAVTSPSIASHHFLPEDMSSPDFVSRVSGLPIVGTALRAYEQSKASSRVVKYGAEMMESSVKSISRPVIDRLPVNQIDEFACRQLDRLGKYGNPGQDGPEARRNSSSSERGRPKQSWEHSLQMQAKEQALSVSSGSREPSQGPSDDEGSHENERLREQQQQQVAALSRWQAILFEAGGIGAAVSEESMRRLKYCLQWLQYATEHIDAQILVLRNFITSLSANGETSDEQLVSASHLQTLTDVKRDVVNTIRQVVDVVSKYAGGALPEPARARVRQFILHLPQRWASTTQTQVNKRAEASSPGQMSNSRHYRDTSGNQIASGSSLPLHTGDPGGMPPLNVLPPIAQGRTPVRPTAVATTQAAQRILTLATESLDMMRSVTGVFKESLDRAEAWVERLRIIGLQRQQQNENGAEDPTLTPSGAQSYQPPSAESAWPDAPSPSSVTASSLNGLSLSSAYATPKSRMSSLPDISDAEWDYVGRRARAPRSLDPDEDVREDERAGISAIRGTMDRTQPEMDVDD